MRTAKRIIAILFAVLLLLTLAVGCGARKEEELLDDFIEPEDNLDGTVFMEPGEYVLVRFVDNGTDLGGTATTVLTIEDNINGAIDLGLLDADQLGRQTVTFSQITNTLTVDNSGDVYTCEMLEDGTLYIGLDESTYMIFALAGSEAAQNIDDSILAALYATPEQEESVEIEPREMEGLNVEHGNPEVEGELYSDEYLTVSATGAYWDAYCFGLNMNIQSNTDQTFALNCNSVTVNGVSVNAYLYAEFEGSEAVQDTCLYIDAKTLYEYGIVDVYTLTVQFALFDETFETIEYASFTVYPMGEDNAQQLELDTEEAAIKIVDDENIGLYVMDTFFAEDEQWGDHYVVRLGVVNYTDDPISLYAMMANINGNAADPYYAQEVTAQSFCYSNVEFAMSNLEMTGIHSEEDIQKITIQLQIVNDIDWDEIYWDKTITFAVPDLSEETLEVVDSSTEDDASANVVIEITDTTQGEFTQNVPVPVTDDVLLADEDIEWNDDADTSAYLTDDPRPRDWTGD